LSLSVPSEDNLSMPASSVRNRTAPTLQERTIDIKLKRASQKPADTDGFRVLVDRIWPRGLKKDEARVDWWAKEIAPSAELRRWFSHDPEKWEEFKGRYFLELEGQTDLIGQLRRLAEEKRLTLIFGARDEEHNNAVALKEYLKRDM
jgi:uncharacterized protein YeaO (DUF488 family)